MSKTLTNPAYPELAAALASRNITQSDFARSIGERPDSLSKVQGGRLNMPPRIAMKIEKALAISLGAPRPVAGVTQRPLPSLPAPLQAETALAVNHPNGYDTSGVLRLLEQLRATKERTETQILAAEELLGKLGYGPTPSTQQARHLSMPTQGITLDRSLTVDKALVEIARQQGGVLECGKASEIIYQHGIGGYRDARAVAASMYYFVKRSGLFVKTAPGTFRLSQ